MVLGGLPRGFALNHDIQRSSALLQAAALAAGAQQYPKGALYVVATPIGNMADLTLRAIHVLSLMDAVACEDTRVGGQLLQYLGLHKPLVPIHQHNEREAAEALLPRLAQGERIAFISDAGTPAVSDPGARLVAALHMAGIRCIPVPGVTAVGAALSVVGDAGDAAGFRFLGFVPAKGAARQQALTLALQDAATIVLYESPHRIQALVQSLAALAPTRTVSLARELTKQFESISTMAAAEGPAWLAGDPNRSRGEFVVVVHGKEVVAVAEGVDQTHDALLQALLAELPVKQAVTIAVAATGAPRNALYERALALKATLNETP